MPSNSVDAPLLQSKAVTPVLKTCPTTDLDVAVEHSFTMGGEPQAEPSLRGQGHSQSPI